MISINKTVDDPPSNHRYGLVTTGYFYGVNTHFINGVLFVLISGITRAITSKAISGPIYWRYLPYIRPVFQA